MGYIDKEGAANVLQLAQIQLADVFEEYVFAKQSGAAHKDMERFIIDLTILSATAKHNYEALCDAGNEDYQGLINILYGLVSTSKYRSI